MPKLKFSRKKRWTPTWRGKTMEIIPQTFEPECPVDSVTMHPRNPRRGNLDAIGESVTQNKFYGAIVIQASTRYILAGNHRWIVAKNLNAPHLPAIVLDVDDETALRIMLADNRTAEMGSFDDEGLASLLTDLQGDNGTLRGTGYDGLQFEGIVIEAAANEYRTQLSENGGQLGELSANRIPAYSLVFASEEQQQHFHAFMRKLKERYPEPELTSAGRLMCFIAEQATPEEVIA